MPDVYDGPERRSLLPDESRITTWSRAVAVVGIPGVFAGFLIYMQAKEMPRIAAKVEASHAAIQSSTELERQHAAQTEELLRLMRWICANTAGDGNDRRNCFEK